MPRSWVPDVVTTSSPVDGFADVSELDETLSSALLLATCERLGPDRVVLKILHDDATPEEQRLFVDGNELAIQHRHPNVIRILDTGTSPDGRPWVAMPYHRRGSLADARPLEFDEVLHIGVRIADVLAALHDERAMHRDVKPANILIGDDDEPVLTDLNVAGRMHGHTGSLATSRLSRDYAAPEVLEHGRYSVRSEVYALGATLLELLDDVPADLAELLRRMTAAEPDQRPESAAAVAAELRGLQRRYDLPVTGPTPPFDGRGRERVRQARNRAGDAPAARIPGGAADELADAVKGQWESEAGVRKLYDPYPLPVSWGAAPEDLVVDWASIVTAATSGAGPRPDRPDWAMTPDALCGTNDDLVDVVLRRVPTGRLVILGRPGAGKTILLVQLVLGLLADRASGDPVPVLLSLASWNPAEQELRTWLRAALVADNPWLRRRLSGTKSPQAVDALLDANLIHPILDGLDEIPENVRPQATTKINAWLGASKAHRLALSCRLDEFTEMVRPSAGTAAARLTGTAGVAIERLAADDVRDYLERDTAVPDAAAHWKPVVERLGDGGPVDETFRLPLMVGLARTVCGAGGDSPETLCDPERFPDRTTIERYLFDGFIPAAYRDPPDDRHTCPWPADRAERWLRNLAGHLGDPLAPARTGPVLHAPLGQVDLAWWELYASVPRWVLGLLVAAVPAVAVGVAAVVGPALGIGLGVGLLLGVATALLFRRISGPRRTGERRPIVGIAIAAGSAVTGSVLGGLLGELVGIGRGPLGGMIGAIAVGLAVGPLGRWVGCVAGGLLGGAAVGLTAGVGQGLVAGIVDGLGAALAVGATVVLAGRRNPARGVRGSRWLLWPALAAAAVGGAAGGFTAGPVAAVVTGAAGFCLGLLNPDADLRTAISPLDALRRDRGTFLVFGLIAGSMILAGASIAVAPVVGVAGGLSIGLVFASLQATWSRYAIARVWLALRRELPWRLMAFLQDAHAERGVLRQVGAVYQFRHVELQRRLVEST